MSPCGSTIRDGTWAASGFASGVYTLGGGVTCWGADLMKISASFFSTTISLSPNVVIGLVGVGLRRTWVSPEATCVDAYFDKIIGSIRFSGKTT